MLDYHLSELLNDTRHAYRLAEEVSAAVRRKDAVEASDFARKASDASESAASHAAAIAREVEKEGL
ncbi:MAG: hypothetical protein ABFE07_23540 [Armatimonadia bacterium]